MALRKSYKRFFIRDILSDHDTDSEDNARVSPLDALMQMTVNTFSEYCEKRPVSPKYEEEEPQEEEEMLLNNKHQVLKKRRKSRTAFTNQQIYELEKRFMFQKYLTPSDRDEIASKLNLSCSQVITWFQNRRAKLKRDIEELKNDMEAAKSLPSSPKEGSDSHKRSISVDQMNAPPEADLPTKRVKLEKIAGRKLLHRVENMVGQRADSVSTTDNDKESV